LIVDAGGLISFLARHPKVRSASAIVVVFLAGRNASVIVAVCFDRWSAYRQTVAVTESAIEDSDRR
jgi:hypothetical protein